MFWKITQSSCIFNMKAHKPPVTKMNISNVSNHRAIFSLLSHFPSLKSIIWNYFAFCVKNTSHSFLTHFTFKVKYLNQIPFKNLIQFPVLTLHAAGIHSVCSASSCTCRGAQDHRTLPLYKSTAAFYEVRLLGPENSMEFNILPKGTIHVGIWQ